MPTQAEQPSLWSKLAAAAKGFSEWVEANRPQIEAAATWGTVMTACREAKLYAPVHPDAWLQIRGELRAENADSETIIVSAYGPGGVGLGALRDELLTSPLLADRRRETREVVESLEGGRNYVATCGALPLIEYVITWSAGKWKKDLAEHIKGGRARLHDDDFDPDPDFFLDYAAVEMVLDEIPHVWQSGPQHVGTVFEGLNRHLVLHGTGIGWDDAKTATRAVLLLAASARVAGPLFGSPEAQDAPVKPAPEARPDPGPGDEIV